MRIGISRPAWQASDNQDIFRIADELGYDGVQIKPHQYDQVDLDAERFEQMYGKLTYLAKGGLITYPGSAYRTWEDKLTSYIAFASALNADQVCICSDVRAEHLDADGVKGVAEVLNSIGKAALAHGVTISLHNHADTIFESIDDLHRVFEHIDPRYCGLTFDTAHAAKGGITDLAAAVRAFKPYLNNVHLKDLSAEGQFRPVGTGTLDLVGAVRGIQEIGYSGWMIVDEETEGISVRTSFELSMDFLKQQHLKS